VREDPGNPSHLTVRAHSLRGRGLALLDLGDPAGAAADTRNSLALWDGLPARAGGFWFEKACCHATLSALAGRDDSGVPTGPTSSEAEQALALLRKAVDVGYRDPAAYRTETALDPLRDRADFKLLMMDLAMPADPFAKGR